MSEQTLGQLFAEYEKTSAITVLPAGKHKLEVSTATVRGKGVIPTYKILEGPDTGKRAMAGVISPGDTEEGRVSFFRKLEKFGLGKEYFTSNPEATLADIAKALVGRVVVLELAEKEWNGEPRNEMGFNIELVSSPPLPAVGGVPNVVTQTVTTPIVNTPPTSDAAAIPTTTVTTAIVATDADPGF